MDIIEPAKVLDHLVEFEQRMQTVSDRFIVFRPLRRSFVMPLSNFVRAENYINDTPSAAAKEWRIKSI